MSDILGVFIKNIKYYRRIKGVSQKQMSEATGIEQGRLSLIENGKVEPGIYTIEKIANGLGITTSELLRDTSNPNTSLDEKLAQIESLSLYDQRLIDALLESLLEKTVLVNMQDLKMKKRLEELENIRRK